MNPAAEYERSGRGTPRQDIRRPSAIRQGGLGPPQGALVTQPWRTGGLSHLRLCRVDPYPTLRTTRAPHLRRASPFAGPPLVRQGGCHDFCMTAMRLVSDGSGSTSDQETDSDCASARGRPCRSSRTSKNRIDDRRASSDDRRSPLDDDLGDQRRAVRLRISARTRGRKRSSVERRVNACAPRDQSSITYAPPGAGCRRNKELKPPASLPRSDGMRHRRPDPAARLGIPGRGSRRAFECLPGRRRNRSRRHPKPRVSTKLPRAQHTGLGLQVERHQLVRVTRCAKRRRCSRHPRCRAQRCSSERSLG